MDGKTSSAEGWYKVNMRVLYCQGPVASWLKGLTSQDLSKTDHAFLNIHGRLITTALVRMISDAQAWIIVPNDSVQELMEHVSRYARLSQVSIQISDESVYVDLGGKSELLPTESEVISYFGRLVISQDANKSSVTDDEFTLMRLLRQWPWQGVDFLPGEMILNVHEHHYVSYTKGCYLGQEPVAKVHHRSRPTWKLVVLEQSQCPADARGPMTSLVRDPQTGLVRGFVFVKNNQ